MGINLRKFDPAVDKKFLVAVSGLLWSIVGVMLCRLAVIWLLRAPEGSRVWPAAAGTVLALLVHHFGFLKIVDKNISRITAKKGKVCIFGFQPWRSYFLIAVMVGMGLMLRNSPLPKYYLSIIYTGFGGAMFLSSLRYFRIFISLFSGKAGM